jgi:hypothetical protein
MTTTTTTTTTTAMATMATMATPSFTRAVVCYGAIRIQQPHLLSASAIPGGR